MLSYVKNIKVPGKKHASPPPQQAEAAKPEPVLTPADENFLQSAIETADEPAVILPGSENSSDTAIPVVAEAAAEAEKEAKKEDGEWKAMLTSRWDGLKRTVSSAAEKRHVKSAEEAARKQDKKKRKEKEEKGKEKGKEKEKEHARPEDELTEALEQLNLAAKDGRAFSCSAETKALLSRFTQIMKDVSTGVPTAYDDLIELLSNSSSQLEKTFTGLPSFLQKLIKTLPAKIKPELMQAAAAASPALATEGGFRELVTKPGMLMGLLKSVVNVLKTRFPAAALGANAALSMALFVVLLVLWYCHKRGKEVRLEREEKERIAAASVQEAEQGAQAAAQTSATEGDLQGGSKY